MKNKKQKINSVNILMADDDADDRMLMKEAFDESNLADALHFVEDGEELLQYLYKTGKFSEQPTFRPDLILLDLNMPKIDGKEALRLIKSDVDLRRIPVVVLSTSRSEADVVDTYDLGSNSFICKPVEFDQWGQISRELKNYWFGTVTLPFQ
jgi:two-component system response regulator